MRTFKGPSLRSRLYLMLLVLFIPVAILIFLTAEEQKDIEKQTIFQGVMMLARATALEERQHLNAAQELLKTMADLYASKELGVDQLQALAAGIAKRSMGYEDIGLLHKDGSLIASALGTKAGRAGHSQKTWFEESLKKPGLSLGTYGGDWIGESAVLYVAIPVVNEGQQVIAVAFTALSLDWMNRAIVDLLTRLPVKADLALADDDGGVLRYDTGKKKWARQEDLPQTVREQIKTRRTGLVTARNRGRDDTIYAFAPLESHVKKGNARVILQIPEKRALAASRQLFLRNVTGLALFALLASLLVWWSAEALILRRVRQLVRASRGIATGDLSTRVGDVGGRDELSHLAGVFDDMADALQLRQRNERKAVMALQQSRVQLRNLTAHQQNVLEEERIRIAREIHDQLGQSLTILKMDLSWLNKQIGNDQKALKDKIDTMFEVIDNALKTMHTVMAELRPVILDDFGLAAAIEWQAEEFQNRTGIACRVDAAEPPSDLPKAMAIVVFRIFQELLTNIIRHAEAGSVEISLRMAGDNLTLQMTDDGRGITDAQINNPESYGLIGIRERLHPWAGTVQFRGQDDRGTEVTVTLPFHT